MDDADESDYEHDEPAPLPQDERKLVTQSYDLSVNTLVEQWTDKTLVLPEIQREYVWDNPRASRLIESLLLNVPIPVLYLAESGDRYEVIDGHQRIWSVVRYMDNQFRLSGLRVLDDEEHRGKRYHQLAGSEQRRIRTRVMRAIIITEESHPSMKFEVFERLNSGSIALNAQEIRNSTHRGRFNDVIKTLVKSPDFRLCVGGKQPRKRMVDNELILRFFALSERLDSYRPPLARFLNTYLEEKNQAADGAIEGAQSYFAGAIGNVAQLYGSHAFRLTDKQGKLLEKSLNRALAETQLVTLARCEQNQVRAQKGKILQALGGLHTSEKFLDDIQRATGDRTRTRDRLNQYEAALRDSGVSPHLSL